jgi:hypothetical protein
MEKMMRDTVLPVGQADFDLHRPADGGTIAQQLVVLNQRPR